MELPRHENPTYNLANGDQAHNNNKQLPIESIDYRKKSCTV